MGFNINPTNKPIIREASNMQNDGGSAGNTGYLEQEGGEKKKKENVPESIFDSKATDAFVREGEEKMPEDDFSFSKLIAQIILFFKNFFKR